MRYQYRYHQQPGCGGCLVVGILLLLLFGGAPLLVDVIGFLFVGFLFTLFFMWLGFWGFSFYIKRKVSEYEQGQTEARKNFVSLLVHILVKIAQFDGTATKAELQAISNFFRTHLRYNQEQMYWVKELIKDASSNTDSLETLLSQFRESFAYEPRLILVELVYQVLFTNHHVSDHELELAQNIAEYLNILNYDLLTIQSKYIHRRKAAATKEEEYYEILGLQAGTDFEQIKKSYRKLSMKYHPDKVGHLGEEFRKVAEEKMKEINGAYHHFKTKYNSTT
jgi:DnaJ like chaperone protein